MDGPFDVILFRNVSIYFDEATRRTIQHQLKQLLAPNGILLCGVTETLGNDLGVFSLKEEQGVFYFQADLPMSARSVNELVPVAPQATNAPVASEPAPPCGASARRAQSPRGAAALFSATVR